MARINEHTPMALVIEIMEVHDALKGKHFSITGHLGRPRKDIVAIIKQAGGYFDKTPVWGTDFLISNLDWNEGSTITKGASRKLLAAREKGISVISEAQFYEMICEQDETSASFFE